MNIQSALAAYIERTSEEPFDWRSANCVHFAARWVKEVEGRDVIGALADAQSLRDATRRLAKRGGVLKAADGAMARARIEPAFAQIGDVVSAPAGENGRALGICCGRTAAFRVEPSGILHVPMTEVDAAWPVGRLA